MKKQVTKQKGFSPAAVIAAVGAAVVIVVLFLLTQKGGLFTPEGTETQQTTQNAPAIQNVDDLDTTTSELDSTNLDEVDKELDQISADASEF